MRTTRPATRPAHSGFHFRKRLPDADVSRLGEFPGRDPANPLVASERRYILPERKHLQGRDDSFSKIRRKFVYRTGGDSFFGHNLILSILQRRWSLSVHASVLQDRWFMVLEIPISGSSVYGLR